MIVRIATLFGYFLRFVYEKSIRRDQAAAIAVVSEAVGRLGGLYVKLAQFVCLRTELFSDDERLTLLSFYDAVPCVPIDVEATLAAEIGQTGLSHFRFIEKTPFASGTFGQVYKAQLKDGTDSIVKVKRPNIVGLLRVDFFLLHVAGRIISFLYDPKIVSLPELIQEFEETTWQELDYRREAESAEYFWQMYQKHPEVVVPKTYREFCTDKILVQEYIGGVSVTALIRLKHEGRECEYRRWLSDVYHTNWRVLMTNFQYELSMQGITSSVFYADPHPGNIKILPDNRIALIDFGIVGTSPADRQTYLSIISLMVRRAADFDMGALSRAFLSWGARDMYESAKTFDEYFATDGTKLAEAIASRYAERLEERRAFFRGVEEEEEENFVKIYYAIIKAGREFRIKIPDGLLAVLRSVVVLKAWTSYLDPEFRCMRVVYQRVLNTVQNKSIGKLSKEERPIGIERAVEKLLDWVGDVAQTDTPFARALSREMVKQTYA